MQQEQFIYSQKNNFSGGELTPTIEGRTEAALYQNGVKKLINFMLLLSGGIMRRHGTQFVHLFNDNVPKKMAAVMFSRKLSYLLVFEAHKDKTQVLFFVGGELFLASKILKDNEQDFHFRPKDFSYTVFQGIAYISFGANKPIFKFSVDPEILEKFYKYIKEETERIQAEHRERPEIASTRAMELAANFPDKDRLFIIEPLECLVNYFKTAHELDKDKQRPFNEVIYNAEIDKINDELKNLHEQAGANIYEAKSEKLFCSNIVTFENRLWCFGVNKNIHNIWASYKGDFGDFRMAYKTLLEARNPLTAFSATFSSATFDSVLWSVPFSNELLLGTTDGIYLVKEGDRAKGELIKIHKEIDLPVSPIKPVVLGKTIFFVEGNNCKINSLYYSQEKGGFQVSDITAYAEHIFAAGIRQIAGSNSPFSTIYAVLKNGSFATFTYCHDLKIMGWSQHWLGGEAQVQSITPIYADNEDLLYFHARRLDETGTETKEYLEVLQTRYFSAKGFEMHRPVYADCHVDIQQPGENAAYHSIMQSIKDDTAFEFRGGITKLEHMVQAQAESILKLQLDKIDIASSFKYKNKLVADYGENKEAIEVFLKQYYNKYFPQVMETLAASFAYHRIFGQIYASLENVFCGSPECLAKVEQLFYDGERLGGDIIKIITGQELNQNVLEDLEAPDADTGVQSWDIPTILRDGGLMEYPENSAFSFHPTIVSRIKLFNVELIKVTAAIVKDIVKAAKEVIDLQFAAGRELIELRTAVSHLNKRMLLHYAKFDSDNAKELIVNLKKFFQDKSIDFYPELLNIAHPHFTGYLFSRQAEKLVKEKLSVSTLTQDTTIEQVNDKTIEVTQLLIKQLEKVHTQNKVSDIAAFKRKEEITALIKSIILDPVIKINLNTDTKEYISSKDFDQIINQTIDDFEFAIEEGEDDAPAVESEEDEEESVADKVYSQMQELKEALKLFQSSIIEYCTLVMPSSNPALLKTILQDEKNIALEKYLLLSKKYFPVFKKMFPDIGGYELSVIARNCMPSFRQLTAEGILPIFKKIAVSIIGDGELHDLRILDNETIKLKHPVRYLAIGFPYSSVLQTFPFIFPDEVEHAPKFDAELGLKVFNTKGGYIEETLDDDQIDRQHINHKHVDSDALIRFVNDKKYLATKEISDLFASPYKSGWIHFTTRGKIKTDIDFTFRVDKPYPVSILKIYARARILASYKGM